MSSSWTNRRILITGASSGIGRAVAQKAAQKGATLILTARRGGALEELKSTLLNAAQHTVIAGDLADAAFARDLPRLATQGGPLAGFVHAAGTCRVLPAEVYSEELVLEPLRVSYLAFMLMMRGMVRKGAVEKGFSAVAVSSVASESGWAGGAAYAGAKGALSAAVRALALELAPRNMRINAVCPAHVDTPLLDGLVGEDPARRTTLAAQQPLGLAQPEQIADAICFLLDAASVHITGVNLPVDGGYLAR